MTDEDRAWQKAQIDEMEARLEAKIERAQATILAEFRKWSNPIDLRMRSHSATLRVLDIEQEVLADRVQKLQRPSTQ